jgi:phage shock protein E
MSHHGESYIKISPSKARKLLRREPDTLLVDVRNPEEYIEGHIPGSINIPLQVLGWEMDSLSVCPYTPIMVYCKTGVRAASAASILVQKCFQNVYTLGGIESWPYEIESFMGW